LLGIERNFLIPGFLRVELVYICSVSFFFDNGIGNSTLPFLVELQRRNSTFGPPPQRLMHCGVLNLNFFLEHFRNSRKRPVVVNLRNSHFPPSCGAATQELEKIELPRRQKTEK